MKKSTIIGLIATGALLCSAVQAGNNPNTTRTLTNGIGSGSTATGVNNSLPYNSHASKRNSKADGSLTNYRSGYSRRPDSSYRTTSSAASGSRPTTIPASLPEQASGHTPSSIGSKPASVGGTPPTSIPATIPSQAIGHVPTSIGRSAPAGIPTTIGGSTGSGVSFTPPPTSIPATIPSQAAGHVPTTIGGSTGSGVSFTPPPTSIPAAIPSQAAGRVPVSIGRP
jgi:hypothetical protein